MTVECVGRVCDGRLSDGRVSYEKVSDDSVSVGRVWDGRVSDSRVRDSLFYTLRFPYFSVTVPISRDTIRYLTKCVTGCSFAHFQTDFAPKAPYLHHKIYSMHGNNLVNHKQTY